MTIKFLGIFIIGLCLASFLLSILIYAYNRKKYYTLLEEFQKRHVFPAPYSFHCLVGFFGAAPMSYFFMGIMKKKKVFFLNRNSSAYDFFDDNKGKSFGWISALYYAHITSFICVVLIALLGAALELKARFFP